MNKIIINTAFVIITVLLLLFLGKIVFLSNLEQEYRTAESELSQKKIDINGFKEYLSKTATDSQKVDDNIVLSSGQEGQLMGLFINEGMQTHFKVKTYDLYSMYKYKPENNDNTNENGGFSTNNNQMGKKQETLVELGEDGMPVNAYSDTDNDEWEGVNIIPIKMSFTATKSKMNTILEYFKQLPVNTVRAADFTFSNDKISGDIVLAFPINDFK